MSAPSGRLGAVLMAYGTPARPEDVESFYTDVRRGRPPSPEQLADLVRRYRAVGGTSQLAARTAEQVAGVAAALERAEPGRFVCRYGSKHASPRIEEAVEELAKEGVSGIVGLVLAPHYSSASVGEYLERAGAAASGLGLPAVFVEDWHLEPVLVDLLAERVEAAFGELGVSPSDRGAVLLVTAHSLPVRVIESGDGYDRRLGETAEALAAASGAGRVQVCWQSAGRTPEPWIGPDVLQVIASLPASGATHVVVCPAGFTSDHLEVNYDLDVEAAAAARAAGLAWGRTASLNAEPRLCEALGGLLRRAAAELRG
ncbi:MAG TPA: ferrochelatase [Acidimicrobiales bacterium]|nr:ferrochelatase [Acidimicrobiales bacterium]